MDDHRFDDLTRTLGSATSRREALKRIGGGLLGALAGALGAGRATAQTGPGGSDCGNNGQSCTAQKCCGGFTCLVDGTSGTEKFCCPDNDVCGQCCLPTGGVCLGGRECTCPALLPDRCPRTVDNPFGECVDLDNDLLNCGRCGNACPGPANDQPCGKAACLAGVCAIVPDTDKIGDVCRAKAGDCDVAETCNGLIAECPPNLFEPATTLCRAKVGPCDVDEFCTGTAAQCPENEFLPEGTVCRDATDLCDLPATCTGTGAQCPDNPFKLEGVVCRPAAGLCDVTEVCTGNSAACPPNTFAPASRECRPAVGPCDKAEFCPGNAADCPADEFLTGIVCRPAAGPCDVDEVCTGTSGECPENRFVPAGTVCRDAAGECDIAATCTGNTAQCPDNGFKANGIPCDLDDDLCTLDTCQNGVCQEGSQRTCPASTDPCKVNVCVPLTGACETQNAPNNTPCNDNNLCTTGETCQNGTCQGGTQKICPPGVPTSQACDPTTGNCVCPAGTTTCGGTNCCSGDRSFCCPAGTTAAGQCRQNRNRCNS